MTENTAVLGIVVDSSQAKRAVTDLKDLANAANSAEKATNDLGTAATKSGTSIGVIQSMAKRAGVSFEEMDSRIAKAKETANKAAVAIQAAGSPAVTAGLSLTAKNLLTSYNWVSLALQGITAASSAYIALNSNNGPKVEETLSEQARLLGLVKDAYRDAANKAGEFFESSKAVLKLQTELNINDLQTNIRGQIADALKSSVGYTANVNIMGDPLGTNTLDINSKLAPFRAAIEDLNASIAEGGPAVERYRNAIAGIGDSNPALKDAAGELLKASQAAGDTTDKLNAAYSQLRLLTNTATAQDRARLGLSNRIPVGRDPFDAQVTSVNKHIAAMKADAEAVDATAGEHAKFRVQAQLLEAAQRNGSDATEAQKRKIMELSQAALEAGRALAQARIDSDIKFGRQTSLLSSDDVAIASKLRDLYGNDVPMALASTEAAALRANGAMSNLSNQISGGLTTALTDISMGTASAGEAFRNFGLVAIRAIEEMIIKLLIVQPLMRSFQGLIGGGGLLSLLPFSDGGYVNPGSSSNPLPGLNASDYGPGYASGGYTGSGGKFDPAGIVHRGEYVFNQAAVNRIGVPNLERIHRGYADGGFVGGNVTSMGRGQDNAPPINITYAPVVDARGADAAAVARLEVVMARNQRDFEKNVQGVMAKYRANTPGSNR